MTEEKMIEYAIEEGFTAAEMIDTDQIVFDPSFRPLCEENLCGQYGVNYSCPPECGTAEEMKQRILAHKKGLVLQTIWEISDYTDQKAIKHAKSGHNSASQRLMRRIRQEGCQGFMIGASGCALCTPCALVDKKPCNYPELRYSCMSAYCIFVRKLTESCGIEYNCGDGLLAFFGMYVWD
ncbi:MAG: DUF2284 domain-containing protein [Lachnospiraceae bacterium]|nr:DUF2284 domain-containing protein [Lachnospiraceae bacterium]